MVVATKITETIQHRNNTTIHKDNIFPYNAKPSTFCGGNTIVDLIAEASRNKTHTKRLNKKYLNKDDKTLFIETPYMFEYRNTRVEYADQVATTKVDIQ